MVEKLSPDIERLDKSKCHADVGQLEELTKNKDKIGQLCSLQKINLERAENLGTTRTFQQKLIFRQKYGDFTGALQCNDW